MAAPLSAASRVVASRNQVSTNVAGETVILGMGEGIYYGLDSVGTRIWALIQEPCTLGAVSATVESEYHVSYDQALVDVVALADDLVSRGLAEVVPVPAAS